MKSYTAQVKQDRPTVLMREGWSWGASVFGPIWLLSMRAWIPAFLELAALMLLVALVPLSFWRPALLGFGLINGLLGRDMVRWALGRRGYAIEHVIVAPDQDAALLRLFTVRPDLVDDPR